MHIKRGSLLLIVAALLVLVAQGWAQDADLLQQVALSETYSISIPDDWDAQENEALGTTILLGDSAMAVVAVPDVFATLVDVSADDTLEDVLVTTFETLLGGRARLNAIEPLTLGSHPAVSYRFSSDEITLPDEMADFGTFEGLLFIIDFSEEGGDPAYGLYEFAAINSDLNSQVNLAKTIGATFSAVALDPKTGQPIGGQPVGTTTGSGTTAPGGAVNTESTSSAATTSSSASSASCFVSTTSANTVQLHVGPGFNRAVVTFLPANQDFAPTGSFTADDGSEWFQLNRQEAAPTSAAAEVWVNRESVDEEGNCDAVTGAAAPPIIPIINNPPPQPTAVPGAPPATAAPAGGLVPADGNWSVNMNSTSFASCQGTQTITLNTAEIYPDTPLSRVFRVRVTNGGANMTIGSDALVQDAPGHYYGTASFDNGENAQLRLQVLSSASMTGELVGNFTIDGTPCSFTVPVSMQRR